MTTMPNERPSSFRLPVLEWLRDYRSEWLKLDVMAGLTAAAVVIPKAMAYATIAGLPLQVGLYTAFLPMVVYAILGTSRVLSVSTTTTIAILGAAELGIVWRQGYRLVQRPDGVGPLLLRDLDVRAELQRVHRRLAGVRAINLFLRISGSEFRAFVHPFARMRAAAEREGLALERRERPGLIWENAAYERT